MLATRQSQSTLALSPLAWFERLGRRMFDLGFNGFLEKFEAAAGPRAARGLALLVGIAVACVAVNVTVVYVIAPAIELVQNLATGRLSVATVSETMTLLANIALFVLVAPTVLNAIELKRDKREITAIRDHYEVYREATEVFWAESAEHLRRLDELSEELAGAGRAPARRKAIAELRGLILRRQAETADRIRELNEAVAPYQ